MNQSQFLDFMYIPLRKVAENDEYADYLFYAGVWVPDEETEGKSTQRQTNFGRFRFIKASGKAQVLCEMPGDKGGVRVSRAIQIISRHWQNGELPSDTCWASG